MENYTNYEIYWDDLTQEAQQRLIGLHQHDADYVPLAVITKVDLKFEDLEETNYEQEL